VDVNGNIEHYPDAHVKIPGYWWMGD